MPNKATILVIGRTQDGKSTFINRLRQVSRYEGPVAPAAVGTGTLSKTKTSNAEYRFAFPLVDYKVIDRESRGDVPLPGYFDDAILQHVDKYDEGDYAVVPTTDNFSTVEVRLIDTPGLDDSHGDDMLNILNVLQTLNEMNVKDGGEAGINGIVFIANANLAFSDKFQECWRYYEKCMPNLFGGVIVVNTKFSTAKWGHKKRSFHSFKSPLSESSMKRIIRERTNDFANLLGSRLQHFFIDNKPDPDYPVEDLISRNTLYEIMSLLTSSGKMRIDQMNFVKSPQNLDVDRQIRKKLNTQRAGYTATRRLLLENLSEKQKRLTMRDEESQDLHNTIQRCKTALQKVDNSDQFKLGTHNTDPQASAWSVLGKFVTFRHFNGTLDVKEKGYDEFNVEFVEHARGQWTRSDWIESDKTWRGTWQANWAHCPILYAHSYAKNSVVHAANIVEHNATIRLCEIKLVRVEAELDKLRSEKDANNPETEGLTKLIAMCTDVASKLEPEVVSLDVGFDAAAQQRYVKRPEQIDMEDVIAAVRTFQPELAAVLERS